MFEAIAGYGLGGSFVALFGRVGGGIYTKAADVGADLVGKSNLAFPKIVLEIQQLLLIMLVIMSETSLV